MARKSRKAAVIEPVKDALYIRTALYVRLSVEDGHGRSNSIENQQLILNDFVADKPEFMIVDTYIDNGLSGRTFDRPNFQRMLSDIENGKVNCVIVKDLSRLGRSVIDTGYYIEQYFVQHRVRFIAVNDMYDSEDESTSQNGIILPLKNMINEAYALDIGKKIKSAAHQSMLDGDFIGARAPFGYKKDLNNCHKLLIDEETAPIVRQIFEWFINGIGITAITVKLNEMGEVTPSIYKSGKTEREKNYPKSSIWQSFSVRSILTNEKYAGDMVQGKSKTIEHRQIPTDKESYIIVEETHEPIISREMFAQAQQRLKEICEESKRRTVVPYTENIFKGKVFCSHCGKPLHRQRAIRKKTQYKYFFDCLSRTRVSHSACVGVYIFEEDVIDFVSDALKKELASISKSATRNNKLDILKRQKSEKQRELNKVQSLVKGLYESLVSGVISSEDYAEFKNGYAEQTAELSAEIDLINSDIEQLEKQQKHIEKTKDCAKLFKDSKALTADLIDRLIERIEISHEREISITFRSDKGGV